MWTRTSVSNIRVGRISCYWILRGTRLRDWGLDCKHLVNIWNDIINALTHWQCSFVLMSFRIRLKLKTVDILQIGTRYRFPYLNLTLDLKDLISCQFSPTVRFLTEEGKKSVLLRSWILSRFVPVAAVSGSCKPWWKISRRVDTKFVCHSKSDTLHWSFRISTCSSILLPDNSDPRYLSTFSCDDFTHVFIRRNYCRVTAAMLIAGLGSGYVKLMLTTLTLSEWTVRMNQCKELGFLIVD